MGDLHSAASLAQLTVCQPHACVFIPPSVVKGSSPSRYVRLFLSSLCSSGPAKVFEGEEAMLEALAADTESFKARRTLGPVLRCSSG